MKKQSLIFSVIVALLGLIVLTGWIANIPALKSISPQWVSMKVNTAICFLLAGITLTLLNYEKQGRNQNFLVPAFSCIIIFIASVTFFEYIFQFNAGIDELFFKDNLASGKGIAGRMALQTALCFILFGFYLLLFNYKRVSPLFVQWLAIFPGGFAFLGLVGYLFRAEQLTGISHYTAIAFHTAISFLLLMLAALFLRPQAGIMKLISSNTIGGRLFRNSFPAILIIIIIIGWLRLKGEEAGLYDTNFGVSIIIIVVIIVIAVVLFINASSLSRSEKELRDSEEFTKRIIASSNDCIKVLDMDGNLLSMSEGGQKILEIDDINSYLNKSWVDFWKGKDREEALAAIAKAKNGQPGMFTGFCKTEKGKPKWWEVIITPIQNARGDTDRLLSVSRDVTERKKAEEELRDSHKQIADYKYALDQSTIMSMADAAGNVIGANENFINISKYSREELEGKNHRIINSGFHSKEFFSHLWNTIAKGKVWRGEVKSRAKDGTFFWADTTIVPFCNEEGKPYKHLAIRTDITEKKESERIISELNTNLEQKVKERTAQYEAVNKELESFSYSVSHDLRAPLRAINSYAQILAEDHSKNLDEDGRLILKNINYNILKMGNLVDDLLAFSRLGRKELDKTEIDMKMLTTVVIEDLERDVSHHAQIKMNGLHPVYADHGLMYLVMMNLVSNAVKYSSKKEKPVIEISSEEKNNELVFKIKDNGAGFDMRFADKLFGVFQRLHSEEEFEGNGVGLATVKRIISKHGGEAWGESKLNEGATFYFTVPKN